MLLRRSLTLGTPELKFKLGHYPLLFNLIPNLPLSLCFLIRMM
jgi:hypothetical protein